MKKIIFTSLCILCFFHTELYASSIHVYEDISITKSHGLGQTLFVHETYNLNPFLDYQIIVERDGDDILGYRVWWKIFWPWHSLFISSSDSEGVRTWQWWKEKQSWIYTKIILKEDTFQLIDGIYTPNQIVWVSEYYRVEYDHDMTEPLCSDTFYSHDIFWENTFRIWSSRWFREEKYVFFLCEDRESWCQCDWVSWNCFISQWRVLTSPVLLEHGKTASANISNTTWLNNQCTLPASGSIFYDTEAPDVRILVDGSVLDMTLREYVRVDEQRYDGQDISGKKYYNLDELISFKATQDKDISIEAFDIYPAIATEGVSWIQSITLALWKRNGQTWAKTFSENLDYPQFNPDGSLTIEDKKTIDIWTIDAIKNTFSQVWEYQMYIWVRDFAGNESRVGFRYRVVPWDIDATRTLIQADQQNTKYALTTQFYRYSLTLRDSFGNPIPNKEIFNLSHSCIGQINCFDIRQDMTWDTPAGIRTLQIFDEENTSDAQWVVYFSIRSNAPWIFSEAFRFQIYNWDDSYENVSSFTSVSSFWSENTFLKPVLWVLEANTWAWWNNILPIWEEARYRIRALEYDTLGLEYTLSDDFDIYVDAPQDGTEFTFSWSLERVDDTIEFLWLFESTLPEDREHLSLLKIQDENLSPIVIQYVLDGYVVSYRLSTGVMGDAPLQLWVSQDEIEPVRIIGQSVVSTGNIWWNNTQDIRNILRSNIIRNLWSRTHNTTVAWVKYIDGAQLSGNTYVINGSPDFRTLVVRDANIQFEGDFNIWGSSIGIIALKSTWYSVSERWYNDVGNIYIEGNVSQIHAMIYADGWLISTSWWNVVSSQSSLRSSSLSRQLYIKWSVFSRNTLWGSILTNGLYILPWGQTTSQQDIAVQYDLHHLRRWNNACIEISGVCRFPNYLIIEYDSRIVSSPPPLFSQ